MEESSSNFSVSSQAKTEDVYSTIRKPKKDVQPKKEVSAHNSITPQSMCDFGMTVHYHFMCK